jgi:hypothetical protein
MAGLPAPRIRNGLTDEQQIRLRTLETIHTPNSFSQGELHAIRLCATTDAEQARIAALAARWADR